MELAISLANWGVLVVLGVGAVLGLTRPKVPGYKPSPGGFRSQPFDEGAVF